MKLFIQFAKLSTKRAKNMYISESEVQNELSIIKRTAIILMFYDTFVAVVSKDLKDQESELDVNVAHNFLSQDGTQVTADDLIK